LFRLIGELVFGAIFAGCLIHLVVILSRKARKAECLPGAYLCKTRRTGLAFVAACGTYCLQVHASPALLTVVRRQPFCGRKLTGAAQFAFGVKSQPFFIRILAFDAVFAIDIRCHSNFVRVTAGATFSFALVVRRQPNFVRVLSGAAQFALVVQH
jgi:hypothetical protein